MIEDLVEENRQLKEKINELTFEKERLEFELRDAMRELSKYREPYEQEISIKLGPGVKHV